MIHPLALKSRFYGLAALTLSLAVAGCARAPESSAASLATPTATHTAVAAGPKASRAPQPPSPAKAAAQLDVCEAVAELNQMDPRTPVPLQPMMAWHQKRNMQQHLVAIQQITDGLVRKDWKAIVRASATIELSPKMQRMCNHMGKGAKGFSQLGLDFHRRAAGIGKAAKAHDSAGVLKAMSSTLAACTACHATYRQDVMGAAAWQKRTGSMHNPARMHGKH